MTRSSKKPKKSKRGGFRPETLLTDELIKKINEQYDSGWSKKRLLATHHIGEAKLKSAISQKLRVLVGTDDVSPPELDPVALRKDALVDFLHRLRMTYPDGTDIGRVLITYDNDMDEYHAEVRLKTLSDDKF